MKIENSRIEAIKTFLKKEKITYIQLSERCGIPVGTLRNIFSGFIKNPRVDTVQKIEEALGFPSRIEQLNMSTREILKLKAELKRQKITYPKLAEMTGISRSAISKIFSGIAVNPRVETIQKIEDALGLRSELEQPYLTEQEEALLQRFRALSKKGRSAALELVSVLDSYENN